MATKVVSSIPASVSPTHSDSPSTSSSSPKSKLEGEALISALRQQLDFYFSKENLTSDTYLLSHMNVSRSVPLSLISQFPKVRALTEDRDILLQAIKTCKNCQPDSNGTFVKSTAKVERTTLILRDLPLTIPVSAVLAVFNGSDSPAAGHVRDVKADVEDTWYVTLDSEEVTTATAEWILFSSPSVDGHPLRARVKSENLLRGFYNVPASSNPASTTTATNDSTRNPGSAGWRAPHSHTSESSSSPNSTSSNSAPIINMNGHVPNQFAFGFPQQSGYFGAYPMFQNAQAPFPINAAFGPNAVNFNKFANSNAAASSSPRAGKGGPNPKKGKKIIPNTSTISNQSAGSSSSSTSSSLSSSTSSTVPSLSSDASNVEVDENLSNSPRRNKKKGTAGPNSVSAPQSTRRLPLSDANLLGPEHFPALPIAGPPPSSSGRSGYTKPFKHYTREEMASVVESMDGQLSKPAIGNANVVIRDEPLDRPSILDPLPVIYPASPSPLLAAQPYHSSDLPFLDLNVPPPFLMPNMMPNFNAQQQQLDQHKKGLATAAAKGSRSIFSSSSSASNTSISSSSSSSSTSQNKATRSPASKPRSAREHDVAPSSSASTSTTSTTSSSSVPASSTSKPTAAAIVAAAAAKGPVQPTSSATISSKPQSTKPSANSKGTKSKDGEKTAPSSSSDSKSAEPSKVSVSSSSSASSSSSSVGAASSVSSSPATPAAPAAPSKPSFAAALGSMSPAEAAAKAKAIEDARKAKLKAKQEEEDAKKKSNSDNNNNSKEGEEVENSKRFERPPKDKESSGSGYKNRRKYGNHHGKSRRGENDENHPSAHNQQNTNQSDSQNSNSNEDRKPTYADLIKKAAAPSSKSAPSSSSHSQSPSPTSSPPSEIGIAESK